MNEKSPLLLGVVAIAMMIALFLGTLIVKEAIYLAQLPMLDMGGSATSVGRLIIPTFDNPRTDARPVDYLFMAGDTQYQGTAIDDGQSTNQISVRYLVDNPGINAPSRLDTGAEKLGILLRIGGIVAAGLLCVIVVLAIKRRLFQPPPPSGPYTVGRL